MQINDIQSRVLAVQARIAEIDVSRTDVGRTDVGRKVTTGTAAGVASPSGPTFAVALTEAVASQDTHDHDHATAVKPTEGRITSEFGPRWGTQHKGLDLAAAEGTTVRAAGDGVVRRADWYGGYGNAVIIDHGDGESTLYGHNSALNVVAGQKVSAGQAIAKVGSTGDSTGPHVHFEVRHDDKQIDPRPWLERRGVRL